MSKEHIYPNINSAELQEVKYVVTEEGKLKPATDLKKDSFFLYFTVLTATLLILVGSAGYTWPSSVIPKFTSNNTDLNTLGKPISTAQISLIVGVPVSMGFVGSLIGPAIADLLGRKKSIYIFGIGMLLSNTAVSFSTIITMLVISRSLFFVCFVSHLTVLPIYITEICESHNRAKFGSVIGVLLPLGSLYSYLFGPKFSIQVFGLIMGAPLIIFLSFFWLTYETPVYLMMKGQKEECMKALQKLRPNKTLKELKIDMDELEESVKSKANKKNVNIFTIFKQRQGRISVFLASIPILLHHFSGMGIILVFLGPIFSSAGKTFSSYTSSVIVGVVKVCCLSLSVFVVEKVGRKTLLITSSIGCGISFFLLGSYFYLKHIDFFWISHLQLLPVISVIFSVASFAAGLGPLPNPIMGELFSPDFRSAGVSFISTIISVIVFVYNTLFPILSELIGIHSVIWIFSCICFIGAVIVYVFLPETRGLSISEIQEIVKNYGKRRETIRQ